MENQNFKYCINCNSLNQKIKFCCECRLVLCSICEQFQHNNNTLINHTIIGVNERIKIGSKNSKFYKYYFCKEIYTNVFKLENKFENDLVQTTYRLLVEQANQGILLMPLQSLQRKLELKFIKNFDFDFLKQKLSNEKFQQSFKFLQRNLMHKLKIDYVSLKLHRFSIESLTWVLKSLCRDELKPTITLVQSRFKECFGYNIPGKEWNQFVQKMFSQKQKLKLCNKYQEFLGRIVVKEVQKELVLGIDNMVYQYNDMSEVNQGDEDYQEFLQFVENFFCQENQNEFDFNLDKNSEIFKLFKNKKNFEQLLQEKKIKRAIPGGIYGCVILLKNSEFKQLQNSSLGRLHALVKKALNQQILLHYKTLIILNKNREEFLQEEKERLTKQAQKHITQLVRESQINGITLAQIPSLINEKYGIKYDFQKMGFPKLKNFLLTIPNIELQNKNNSSHIKAKFIDSKNNKKKKNQFNSEKKIQRNFAQNFPNQNNQILKNKRDINTNFLTLNGIQNKKVSIDKQDEKDQQNFNYQTSQTANSFKLINHKESLMSWNNSQLNFPIDSLNFENYCSNISFKEQQNLNEENEEFFNIQIEEQNRKFIDFIMNEDNQFYRGLFDCFIFL